MGLSASQARLLSITARMHDVEYKAQNIMNQKIELATQEDAAYKEYCEALDAKKIQVAFSSGSSTKYVDATFKNVCTYDESGCRNSQYALVDAQSGRMVVEAEVYKNYMNFSNDKYSFAWSMLGFKENNVGSNYSWGDNWGNNIGINAGDGDIGADGHVLLLMTDSEQLVYEKHTDDSSLSAAYKEYQDSLSTDDFSRQKEALKNFRDLLYSNDSWKVEIYDAMRLDKSVEKDEAIKNQSYIKGFSEDFDESMRSMFEYYLRLYEGIESAGGCISVEDFSNGRNLDNEWFNQVINSGKAILSIYNPNGPKKGWQETSIETTITENYLQESTDETNIKKAEAKYEHELNKVKQKDAAFDRDLQNLETERTALNKEMDSIKKVKDDNIERTFGLFS